jgi:hypothetical protein
MAFEISPVTFTISVIGDVSGEKYEGSFKTKPVLTHAEQLGRDAIMRDLLGPNPLQAQNRPTSQAGILAECRVRLLDSPAFWKDSGGGLNLYDENVIVAVYDRILEIEEKFKKDIKDRAEKAKQSLTEIAPK